MAVNLANAFSKRGFLVELVLLSSTGIFLADLDPSIRVIDLKIRRFRSSITPLVRYLRLKKPDALLAFMWPLTVIAIVAKLLARVDTGVVAVEHTTWSRDAIVRSVPMRFLVRSSMHFSFPKASAVVAVSNGAADDLSYFARIDRASIQVIYNPIVSETPTLIHMLTRTPRAWWIGSHRRVLSVGALKPTKDYATLITAFVLLLGDVDAQLLILGEGESRRELEIMVKSLGMESYVSMPGFSKVLAPYYQRTDLFVLSSVAEGFGNVIVEALETGTPVVSTDCQSGPREILLNGKYGELVPVNDPAALASAMLKSLTSRHDPAPLKARAQDFSIEKAVNQYLKLLFPCLTHQEPP